MGYTLREIAAERKFSQELRIEVLEQVLPVATIQAVLAREGRMGQRERKLNMVLTVLLLIVQHIYSNLSQREAMRKVSKGLRYVWPDPEYVMAGASALSYRRYQLGRARWQRCFMRSAARWPRPKRRGHFCLGCA